MSDLSKKTLKELRGDDLAKDRTIVGARYKGRTIDVHTPIDPPADPKELKLVRTNDPEGLAIVRHSTAHVMADAVQRLFPGTKVTFGPATDGGFYYDFDTAKSARKGGAFNEEDLAKIEDKMREIVALKLPFRREVVSRDEARAIFQTMNETYKAEHVDRLPEGAEISLYRHGSLDGAAPGQDPSQWMDLCEGPHVPTTGSIGAVKLTAVAGAYWRGDERNPMLQRIYGMAFATEKELAAHLKMLEEAKERDHRKLGKELELFMFHDYAPAMPFLLPKGAFVYNQLVSYMRELYLAYGYDEVITPQVFDKKLFLTSGHLPNYRENMYLPMTADQIDETKMALRVGVKTSEGESYEDADRARDSAVVDRLAEHERLGLKPMNCPSHCLIFGHRRRSYRELPWRMADFGRLHRYERGGVVHGLARVRTFCQDDAHIFCALDQIQPEIAKFIDLLYEVYAAFKFEKVDIKLATRPDKRIGSDEQWDAAEKALAQALEEKGLAYEVAEGEGAFYGPKLEFHIQDALKRSWQLGTMQVDYQMPERFELEFIGQDGGHHRPVMLHRAILGSLERFLSVLIEHVSGAFPVWLAPEQVRVITVSDKQNDYAEKIVRALTANGLRATADTSSDKLGAKKRSGIVMKIPYILVVGEKEAANETVAPWEYATRSNIKWDRNGTTDAWPMPLEMFIQRLTDEAKSPRRNAPNPSKA